MAFAGWPAEALEFYEGLEADNSRTYWTAHRSTYEEQVRAPMLELLAALEPEFGTGRIFRPYRDVRFSPDKTPYKTHIGARLDHGGYVQLSASGLACGNGYYVLAVDQLDRYRRAVADARTGGRLQRLTAELRSHGITITGHDELKTAPRGYPRDHPRIDLLRLKGLIAWQEWPVAAWLGTHRARERVVEFLRTSQPLVDWLAKHVGPSTTGP